MRGVRARPGDALPLRQTLADPCTLRLRGAKLSSGPIFHVRPTPWRTATAEMGLLAEWPDGRGGRSNPPTVSESPRLAKAEFAMTVDLRTLSSLDTPRDQDQVRRAPQRCPRSKRQSPERPLPMR